MPSEIGTRDHVANRRCSTQASFLPANRLHRIRHRPRLGSRRLHSRPGCARISRAVAPLWYIPPLLAPARLGARPHHHPPQENHLGGQPHPSRSGRCRHRDQGSDRRCRIARVRSHHDLPRALQGPHPARQASRHQHLFPRRQTGAQARRLRRERRLLARAAGRETAYRGNRRPRLRRVPTLSRGSRESMSVESGSCPTKRRRPHSSRPTSPTVRSRASTSAPWRARRSSVSRSWPGRALDSASCRRTIRRRSRGTAPRLEKPAWTSSSTPPSRSRPWMEPSCAIARAAPRDSCSTTTSTRSSRRRPATAETPSSSSWISSSSPSAPRAAASSARERRPSRSHRRRSPKPSTRRVPATRSEPVSWPDGWRNSTSPYAAAWGASPRHTPSSNTARRPMPTPARSSTSATSANFGEPPR